MKYIFTLITLIFLATSSYADSTSSTALGPSKTIITPQGFVLATGITPLMYCGGESSSDWYMAQSCSDWSYSSGSEGGGYWQGSTFTNQGCTCHLQNASNGRICPPGTNYQITMSQIGSNNSADTLNGYVVEGHISPNSSNASQATQYDLWMQNAYGELVGTVGSNWAAIQIYYTIYCIPTT